MLEWSELTCNKKVIFLLLHIYSLTIKMLYMANFVKKIQLLFYCIVFKNQTIVYLKDNVLLA